MLHCGPWGQEDRAVRPAWPQQWPSVGKGWEVAQARKREGWVEKVAKAPHAWVAGLLLVVNQCLPLRLLIPVLLASPGDCACTR